MKMTEILEKHGLAVSLACGVVLKGRCMYSANIHSSKDYSRGIANTTASISS